MKGNTIKAQHRSILKYNTGILEALASEYSGMIKVNLRNEKAVVLKSTIDPEVTDVEFLWDSLIQYFITKQVYKEDRQLLARLTIERLTAHEKGEEEVFPLELRFKNGDKGYDWMRITASSLEGEEKGQLLITIRIINEDRIMRKIIDLFVYENFDYFVLLDAKTNYYTMFSGREGTPLPPAMGDDYFAEVKRYNNQYVAPEDVEWVTHNMSISHIQAMLEKQDKYEFTAGFFNDEGEYRRSRIQFTNYDKFAGLILVTRMDITQVYLEETQKEQKLRAAMREAQHDPMTDLYNKKATIDLIVGTLSKQYRAQAAILFVDIDNFKTVNDTLGHLKGDEVLTYIGHNLKNIAKKDGIAGRIGGDEFLVFLPVIQGMERIKQYAQEICNILVSKQNLGIGNLPVSCSVGISIYPDDGTEFDTLLYKADQALYNVKRHGKCNYSFYSLKVEGCKGTCSY